MSKELKPCPFCGGEASNRYAQNSERAECQDCFATTNWYKSVSEATASWNTRTDTQEVEQLRNELANTGSSKELLELDLKTMRKERDELAAYVERLRQALIDTHAALWVERGLSTIGAKIKAETICPKIDPAQSLTLHDNEVIEKCAEIVRFHEGDNLIAAIRALKTGEFNEDI